MSPKEAACAIPTLVHPDDLESMNMAYLLAIEKKSPKVQMEFRARVMDQGYIWILGQGKIIYNQCGKPIKYYGTHIDITNRKRIEESHIEKEERYQSILYTMNDMFCVMEVIFDKDNKPIDFKLIEMNPAFEKKLGVNYSLYLGESIGLVDSAFSDSCHDMLVKVALTGESGHVICESKVSDHTYLISILNVNKPEDGKIAALISDITRDIKAQSMEETIKGYQDFFTNISHELKTPLNVIFATNQLIQLYLKSDSFPQNKDKIYKDTSMIKQNCYRLTRLINNIVDLSRMDAGFFKLNLKNVNIVDIIDNIVQSVADYIKDKDLCVVFDTDEEEMIIACDAEKIERVILNLISNSIKFTDPGGYIFVNVISKHNSVEVTVEDTGIGIDNKQLELIFNKFHQVDKSLSRNVEGSGIGLSLAKSIVEAQGGKISVESTVNIGSIFRFELPMRVVEEKKETDKQLKSNNKVEMINIEFSDIYN